MNQDWTATGTRRYSRLESLLPLTALFSLLLCEVAAGQTYILGEPTRLGLSGAVASTRDRSPSVSSDGLAVFFHSDRPASRADFDNDLWVATREDLTSAWADPVNVGTPVNTTDADETWPDIASDGMSLYFSTNEGYMVSHRTHLETPWTTPVLVDTAFPQGASPHISEDDLSFYFSSGGDIWHTQRASAASSWNPPLRMDDAINTSAADVHPSTTADNNHLVFMSNRESPRGENPWDIWIATRDPFGNFRQPVNLRSQLPEGFTSTFDPDISPDGTTLYFASRGLTNDNPIEIWSASLEIVAPLVFQNGLTNVLDTNVNPRNLFLLDSASGSPTSLRLVAGGEIGTDGNDNSVEVFGHSVLEIAGGQTENDVTLHGHATLTLLEGEIGDDLQASGDSRVTINGGVVRGDMEANDNARAAIFDAEVYDDVQAFGLGHIELLGGVFREDIEVAGSGSIAIHGGLIGTDDVPDEQLQAFDQGTITLFGTGFSIDGTPADFGPILRQTGELSGVLSDGSPFDIAFVQAAVGQIVLSRPVPEPNMQTLWLALLGALTLVAFMRETVSRRD